MHGLPLRLMPKRSMDRPAAPVNASSRLLTAIGSNQEMMKPLCNTALRSVVRTARSRCAKIRRSIAWPCSKEILVGWGPASEMLLSNRSADRLLARLLASTGLVAVPALLSPVPAVAACTTVGLVTTCDAAVPNPWPTRVGEGNTPAGDNRTVTVQGDSGISVGNDDTSACATARPVTVKMARPCRTIPRTRAGDSPNERRHDRDSGLAVRRDDVRAGARVLSNGTTIGPRW